MSKSWKKTLLLILLAMSTSISTSVSLNLVRDVRAQGGIEYTLSNTGGVTVTHGNPGSTRIIATFTGGSKTNVTLACDFSNIPSNISALFAGSTCSFNPASIIPTPQGNATRLTVTVPATAPFSVVNVTITSKAGSPAPLLPTAFTLTVAAKVAVNPTSTASLSYAPTPTNPNPTFTIAFNISDVPRFGGFIVAVFYNESVILFQGLDYSNNVFGNDIYVSSECTDKHDVFGSGNACSPDITFDAPGVVSLAMASNSGNPVGTNGTLFRLTFSVLAKGFDSIHILHAEVKKSFASTEGSDLLPTVAYDGYFTNMECGAGNLCKPPKVSFNPPIRPVTNRPTWFNGTAVSQNPGGNITVYRWIFGSGLDTQFRYGANTTFAFLNIGEHEVTLSAQDNYTAFAYLTITIVVFRIWTDMGISDLTIDHTVGIFPGTVVHMVATASNLGVNPENSTLRLSINDQIINTTQIVNLKPTLESSLKYDWHTAGLIPRVYRVQVNLDEVRNATTGQILENDTAIIQGKLQDPNNVRLAFIQLVEPLPSGIGVFLGLTLPETLGLGIVLVAVAVFATGLVRKSRKNPEPL